MKQRARGARRSAASADGRPGMGPGQQSRGGAAAAVAQSPVAAAALPGGAPRGSGERRVGPGRLRSHKAVGTWLGLGCSLLISLAGPRLAGAEDTTEPGAGRAALPATARPAEAKLKGSAKKGDKAKLVPEAAPAPLPGAELSLVSELRGSSEPVAMAAARKLAALQTPAATDALLGAIGDGDIGQHFPPSDPQWRGAASWKFLDHAAKLVTGKGGRIAHCDVTLICEKPKVGPHRAAMQARLAEILGIAPDRVSVKATTTEQLGFTGRGEGIAAQATATVALPLGR